MKKHYKPENERKKQISASVLPANFEFINRLATESGMNNFSAALDGVLTIARQQDESKRAIYGKDGEQ